MSDKHKITIDEVRHLALLTRINMTEDENVDDDNIDDFINEK